MGVQIAVLRQNIGNGDRAQRALNTTRRHSDLLSTEHILSMRKGSAETALLEITPASSILNQLEVKDYFKSSSIRQ